MDKIRISQIAKELSKTSKEVLQKAQELGFEVKTASSAVTATQADELYNYIMSGVNPNATKDKVKEGAEEAQSGKVQANKKVEKEVKETKKTTKEAKETKESAKTTTKTTKTSTKEVKETSKKPKKEINEPKITKETESQKTAKT